MGVTNLTTTSSVPHLRLYFNRVNARYGKIWSLDWGSAETEVILNGFVLEGVALVESRWTNTTSPQPRAWLEIKEPFHVHAVNEKTTTAVVCGGADDARSCWRCRHLDRFPLMLPLV